MAIRTGASSEHRKHEPDHPATSMVDVRVGMMAALLGLTSWDQTEPQPDDLLARQDGTNPQETQEDSGTPAALVGEDQTRIGPPLPAAGLNRLTGDGAGRLVIWS